MTEHLETSTIRGFSDICFSFFRFSLSTRHTKENVQFFYPKAKEVLLVSIARFKQILPPDEYRTSSFSSVNSHF